MNRLTARINWLWRLVMTGFCFVLFGAGGLLLSLVWFNLLLIAQRDRAKRRRLARRSIAASFRFFLTVARGIGCSTIASTILMLCAAIGAAW